jgi:hypothetical protein
MIADIDADDSGYTEVIVVVRGGDLLVEGHSAPVSRQLDDCTVADGRVVQCVRLEENWAIERYRRVNALAKHYAILTGDAAHSEGPVSRQERSRQRHQEGRFVQMWACDLMSEVTAAARLTQTTLRSRTHEPINLNVCSYLNVYYVYAYIDVICASQSY